MPKTADSNPDRLTRRDGYWRFFRRVPLEFAHLDMRGIVQHSTNIRIADDPKGITAKKRADAMNAELEAYWAALKLGHQDAAQRAFQAIRQAAKGLGISDEFKDPKDRKIEELLNRIMALSGKSEAAEDLDAVKAVYDLVSVPTMPFSVCAESYIKAKEPGWKNAEEAEAWRASLRNHAYPTIGDVEVRRITGSEGTELIIKMLKPIWYSKPNIAGRVRSRVERILGWASMRGFRTKGDNPARWADHLEHEFPTKEKVRKTRNHRSMGVAKIPGFYADLCRRKSRSAMALRFVVLCASRTVEVRLAHVGEINREKRMWTISAERMKADRDHQVPLSDEALAVLDQVTPNKDGYLFTNPDGNPFAKNALLRLLKRMGAHEETVTHGFRTSFRTWGGDETEYPRDLLELAIAHKVGDTTEQAYSRGTGLKKRHQLMADWAEFCTTGKTPAAAKEAA